MKKKLIAGLLAAAIVVPGVVIILATWLDIVRRRTDAR